MLRRQSARLTYTARSSLASAHGLKARIKARFWFHNMWEHLPSYMVQYAQPVNGMLAEDGLNLHTAQETGFSSFYRQQMLTDTESCCRIFSSFKVITLILKLQKQKSPRKTSGKLHAFCQSWEQLKPKESVNLLITLLFVGRHLQVHHFHPAIWKHFIQLRKVQETQTPPLLLASSNPFDSTVKHKQYKYLHLKESGNTQWDEKVIALTALLIYISVLKILSGLPAASAHFPAYCGETSQ